MYALTTHQIQVERRESHRDNQVYALTTHQLQVERRASHRDNQVYALTTHQLQVERRESHRDNQVYALTTHQLQVERRERQSQSSVCTHHTPATGGEERETEPIKWMGIIRRPWWSSASGGNLARTPGLHPTLYEKCHVIFNDHRESGLPITVALLCVVVHTKHFTIMWGGLSSTTTSVQNPLGWCDGCHRTTAPVRSPHTSYRWREERVIETIKCMRSPHTSYRWRGERVIETIKCMLERSGPFFNISSERRCFLTVVSPSLHWGVRTHTDHRVSTPCWFH